MSKHRPKPENVRRVYLFDPDGNPETPQDDLSLRYIPWTGTYPDCVMVGKVAYHRDDKVPCCYRRIS